MPAIAPASARQSHRAVAHRLEEPRMTRLYTIAEAAEALNVPVSWLRSSVTARRVPHTRLGRYVRFTDAHLTAIVADGERGAVDTVRPLPSQTGRLRRRASR